MPPTFLIFLGLIAYAALTALTLLVFVPMLLIKSKRLFAKKVIVTVLISFPCLIIMGIVWTIILIIPALAFSWLANTGYIPKTPGIILAIICFLAFTILIAISSLYLWYFSSRIIYQRLEKKTIHDFLEKDRVFNTLRASLIRLKIIRNPDKFN